MKALYMSLGSVMCFVMVGCFSNTPDVPDNSGQITQICAMPKYDIVLGKIELGKDNVLPASEFKVILDKALRDSNCFNIQTKKDDKTYTLDVKYNFVIAQNKQDMSAISTKDNAMIQSDVQFNLYNKTNTIQQNATSTLKLSEKKYLGIGENVQITQEQKENVLRRSLKTIFNNLSNMP